MHAERGGQAGLTPASRRRSSRESPSPRPNGRSSSRYPVASQQHCLAEAIDDDELASAPLSGNDVVIHVAGVLMTSGGRTVDEGEDRLMARVGQSGLDRVLECHRS